MAEPTKFNIAKISKPSSGTVVVLTNDALRFGRQTSALGLDDLLHRAAAAASFTGKVRTTLDVLAPADAPFERVVVLGLGKISDLNEHDWLRLGGAAMAALKKNGTVTMLLERPDGRAIPADAVADFCQGALLRAYRFDKYKRKKSDDDAAKAAPAEIEVMVADAARARRAWQVKEAVAAGVVLARDVVNEPSNILGPVEFAAEARKLQSLGVKVDILTEADMKKLGMGALLGVAQGSVRPPRLAVMRWEGGKKGDAPAAFIGKGVVFDTGGISIKPAGGMEDMKGDMGGAAAVIGLMQALAGRKAKANVIGAIGLVENMPDGNAQRPGDIVTSMSGQTIEVINTDAEGRLVLADVVHYIADKYKPRFMIDLATLTGAIIISLGHHYAGMFATDDALARALTSAGEATGERVWRMPLGPEYDKMINSKFADMKNVGGRDGGSITAAQFIKRFVGDTPWVHLDVAGTAFASPQNEYNQSWGSGWGVRILDRLVADYLKG